MNSSAALRNSSDVNSGNSLFPTASLTLTYSGVSAVYPQTSMLDDRIRHVEVSSSFGQTWTNLGSGKAKKKWQAIWESGLRSSTK